MGSKKLMLCFLIVPDLYMYVYVGGRIILACRNEAKAEKAQREIIEETGNQDVVVRKLDLASLKSIKEFAQKINTGTFVRALSVDHDGNYM